MRPPRSVETVIVGAGQAGLVMSRLLSEAGREHVVLDRRSTLGGAWQDRWDAFRLVSPNWTVSVPGLDYQGDDPDGFMPRDELIAHWRRYADAIKAPIELDTDVTRLTAVGSGASRFRLTTSTGDIDAGSVVVAGGPFQRPHVPEIAAGLDRAIDQVHVHQYRSESRLAPGGVLLVGSGQSGIQLAEELMGAGREVTMAVGRCGRFPRTYRGRDVFWWLREMATTGRSVGVPLPTAAGMPSPRLRFTCNPQLSGHGARHDTNLREMAASGLRLVGRLEALEGSRARFAADLPDNLRFADTFFQDRFRGACDTLASSLGLDLPVDEPAQFDYEPPAISDLDLIAEGISTVLWTSGYRPAFDWIEPDVLDDMGLPRQVDGRTAVPGLSFIGTPWLVDMGSANLVGLVRDAEALAATLA